MKNTQFHLVYNAPLCHELQVKHYTILFNGVGQSMVLPMADKMRILYTSVF